MKINSSKNFVLVTFLTLIILSIAIISAEDAIVTGNSIKIKIKINNSSNATNQTNPNANYTQANNTQINNTIPPQNNEDEPDTDTVITPNKPQPKIIRNSTIPKNSNLTNNALIYPNSSDAPKTNNFLTGASITNISGIFKPVALEIVSVIILFVLLALFLALIYKKRSI